MVAYYRLDHITGKRIFFHTAEREMSLHALVMCPLSRLYILIKYHCTFTRKNHFQCHSKLYKFFATVIICDVQARPDGAEIVRTLDQRPGYHTETSDQPNT